MDLTTPEGRAAARQQLREGIAKNADRIKADKAFEESYRKAKPSYDALMALKAERAAGPSEATKAADAKIR